jgi:hypothetical protein
MACPDCKDKNIVTPDYSQATPPTVAEGCEVCGAGGGLGGGIIPPSSGGSVVEVLPGIDILVDDNSYPGVYSFTVNANPYDALTGILTIGAYVLGVLQVGLVLAGKTVDEVRLTWTYNKTIVAQSLANDKGLSVPTLVAGDRDYTYTGIALTDLTEFILTGNDGLGRLGSIINKAIYVTFGNHILWGDYTDMINEDNTDIPALYADLLGQSIIISNTKSRSIVATGGQNRHQFYMLPARLGEVIFEYNTFVGGYIRLKVVSGVIKGILAGGDVETPISITNSEGETEDYYIYQSTNDDQENTTVNIS